MGDNRSIDLPSYLDREEAKPLIRVAIYFRRPRLGINRDIIGLEVGQR